MMGLARGTPAGRSRCSRGPEVHRQGGGASWTSAKVTSEVEKIDTRLFVSGGVYWATVLLFGQ